MIRWIKSLFSSEKKEQPKKPNKKKAPSKTKAKIQPTKKTRGRPRKKQ